LLRGMEGPMGRRVGDVEKEWLVTLGEVLQVLDTSLRDGLGHVEVVGDVADHLLAVQQTEGIEVIDHSPSDAVELVEPAARGEALRLDKGSVELELVVHPP